MNLSTIVAFSETLGVMEVDNETWELFSALKADTLNRGAQRGDFDILNASIARQHNMIVVTNNVSHYEDIVSVENWASST